MKLPSSTLIEIIVAITIISCVIMSGFMILTKMNFSVNSRLKSHAVYESDRLIDSIANCKHFSNTVLQRRSLTYELTAEGYNNYENLLHINLSVSYSSGKLLLKKSKLLIIDNK